MRGSRTDTNFGGTLEFMRLIWALDHVLHKQSKWMARRFGVTGPQRFALRVVGREPDLSAGRLAEILKVHPSTLTGILQRLERRGFLARRVDASDRRRVRLDLTASGRAITASSRGSIEDRISGVLRRTSPARLAATADVLRSMVGVLEMSPGPGRAKRRIQG
jgi:DNA-binding MarR family transcriptional regulator